MKLFQFVGKIARQQNQATLPSCPSCGYALDRPHAIYCTRCRAEIPGARGCTGCGKCKRSVSTD